eukprot:4108171-Pleurochrysis_carterae.AAC.3
MQLDLTAVTAGMSRGLRACLLVALVTPAAGFGSLNYLRRGGLPESISVDTSKTDPIGPTPTWSLDQNEHNAHSSMSNYFQKSSSALTQATSPSPPPPPPPPPSPPPSAECSFDIYEYGVCTGCIGYECKGCCEFTTAYET